MATLHKIRGVMLVSTILFRWLLISVGSLSISYLISPTGFWHYFWMVIFWFVFLLHIVYFIGLSYFIYTHKSKRCKCTIATPDEAITRLENARQMIWQIQKDNPTADIERDVLEIDRILRAEMKLWEVKLEQDKVIERENA